MAPRADAQRSIEAIWHIESARVVAALARLVGDVGLAEDLAQDALVAALEQWPASGVPREPGAWLMAAGRNRAIDLWRRRERFERKQEQLEREVGLQLALDGAALREPAGTRSGEDLLRLIFTCCHPALGTEARATLTLRLVGGLANAEIARAYLVSEATIAQRIVRAKRMLTSAHVRFEAPGPDELQERLSGVLEVLYLIFNEGYAATDGEQWTRPALCEEALRLGRMLAELVPREPEVHGLVALMEVQASRLHARTDAAGAPVLLLDQDRRHWDRLLIGRGLAACERATALGRPSGPYVLQAEIAACHARAARAEETDWVRIAALYEALAQVAPSPVVELNRAVALAMAFGPEVGLAHVDALADEPALAGYHLLPSVRGDLLLKLGHRDEARAELERAAALTRNARERELLLGRAAACG